jgi:hypothetical protein
MPPASEPDLDPSFLTAAFPEFTITCQPRGWRETQWEAVRKHSTHPGLYAVVSSDLSELLAILAAAQPAGPSEPGLSR